MKLFRVETFDEGKNETVGGFVSQVTSILLLKAGAKLASTDEEKMKALHDLKDPEVLTIYTLLNSLCDIPKPPVYEQDHENYYCLYTQMEFDEKYSDFLYLTDVMSEITGSNYHLQYREFEIPEKEIVYADLYQAFFSKETYDKYGKSAIIDYFCEFDEYDDVEIDWDKWK